MEILLSEIIDRMTILKLKIEHSDNSSFREELTLLENAIKEFERRGIKINPSWFEELYEINKGQWNLESSLKRINETEINFKESGKLYIEIQISNKKRVAVKNKIAEETLSGFKDIKGN
jgi:hypothetical protein